MRKKMFESLVEKKKSTKKWLFFPISLLVHGIVIAAVVVLPLVSEVGNLPPVKVFDVIMTAAAPPPPPPPPPAAGSSKKRPKKTETDAPEEAPRPVPSGRPIAPFKIPTEIEDEDIDFGMGDGVPGGVIGGVPDGVPGGVLGGALLGKDEQGMHTELRVSHVEVPKLLKKVTPQYPRSAQMAHVQGIVFLEAVTDISGRVARVRVISGNPLLRPAAVAAVKKWIYEPYIINGVPKPVIFTVRVSFSLIR